MFYISVKYMGASLNENVTTHLNFPSIPFSAGQEENRPNVFVGSLGWKDENS